MTAPEPRKSMEPFLKDEVVFYPHQITAIRDLAYRRSFLLADEMGLGKSLQALTVYIIDVVRGYGETAIVVCPVTLKGNWEEEVQKFTRIPVMVLGEEYDPTKKKKVKLGPAARSRQLQQFREIIGPKILVVNYEQVGAHLKELNAFKFDVAIFDEAHYLKNPQAKRTKACQSLISVRSFMLTGTPMLNQVHELWSILHRIDPKTWPSFWTFKNRYCVFGGYKDKQIIGVKNERELTEKLQKVMTRRLKKDVLNLKEPHILQVKVDLTDQQRKLYDEIWDDMKLTSPTGEVQDIENALTKFLRLKQICGTTLAFTGEDHSNKLERAVEIVEEWLRNGEKVVVMTQFRDVQEAFAQRLDKAMPTHDIWELNGDVPQNQRQPIVNDWSKAKLPGTLVCMIQVAGIGLNMTASKRMLFLDKLFVPGLNKQAVDRIHRIGQDETQPVQVVEMLTRGTIESRVEVILKAKTKLNETIVEGGNADFKKLLIQALLADEDED